MFEWLEGAYYKGTPEEAQAIGSFMKPFFEKHTNGSEATRAIVEASRSEDCPMHERVWGQSDEALAYSARCQIVRCTWRSLGYVDGRGHKLSGPAFGAVSHPQPAAIGKGAKVKERPSVVFIADLLRSAAGRASYARDTVMLVASHMHRLRNYEDRRRDKEPSMTFLIDAVETAREVFGA